VCDSETDKKKQQYLHETNMRKNKQESNTNLGNAPNKQENHTNLGNALNQTFDKAALHRRKQIDRVNVRTRALFNVQ
jgi:hypothetical protein